MKDQKDGKVEFWFYSLLSLFMSVFLFYWSFRAFWLGRVYWGRGTDFVVTPQSDFGNYWFAVLSSFSGGVVMLCVAPRFIWRLVQLYRENSN